MALATPELLVTMRDGAVHKVQAYNADLVAWDRERHRQKWPAPSDAPFMWLEYLAWHALTKTHKILPPVSLREFGELVATIVSTDDEDTADVDPTNRDLEPE